MAKLKARFIQKFKDTCKQALSILDLDSCVQGEGESTTNWVRRISAVIHSSYSINAGSAVLMLEKNCCFLPLKLKLGRLKRHCNDMGELIAALVKYVDSDSTKDPSLMRRRLVRGRRVAMQRGSSIIWRVKVAMVSTNLMAI